jgi:hypothetical protein
MIAQTHYSDLNNKDNDCYFLTFLTPYFNQTDEELLQRVFLRTRWMKQHRFYKLNEVNLIFLTEDEIDDREVQVSLVDHKVTIGQRIKYITKQRHWPRVLLK